MTTAILQRPAASEYAAYYDRYVSLITADEIVSVLQKQGEQTVALFSSCSEETDDFRYAPEKWTVKEVLGHVNDGERIFSYRALRISRGDRTPLASFEQDDYIRNGPFAHSTLKDLVAEFATIRAATLSLFRMLEPEAWTRRGIASNHEVTVRALAYIIAGHELHHRNILQQRYRLGK